MQRAFCSCASSIQSLERAGTCGAFDSGGAHCRCECVILQTTCFTPTTFSICTCMSCAQMLQIHNLLFTSYTLRRTGVLDSSACVATYSVCGSLPYTGFGHVVPHMCSAYVLNKRRWIRHAAHVVSRCIDLCCEL